MLLADSVHQFFVSVLQGSVSFLLLQTLNPLQELLLPNNKPVPFQDSLLLRPTTLQGQSVHLRFPPFIPFQLPFRLFQKSDQSLVLSLNFFFFSRARLQFSFCLHEQALCLVQFLLAVLKAVRFLLDLTLEV